jgi:hypothetical protein
MWRILSRREVYTLMMVDWVAHKKAHTLEPCPACGGVMQLGRDRYTRVPQPLNFRVAHASGFEAWGFSSFGFVSSFDFEPPRTFA